MGKCVAYVAAAVVFMGIGALVAGICVWFLAPGMDSRKGIQEIRHATCVLNGNTVSGTINLEQYGPGRNNPLTIMGNISGLTTGLHGFHIHTFGVPQNGNCTACGGHYNPMRFNHSAPSSPERHVGDLGNINATVGQVTNIQIEDSVASLWGDESITGRSVVVHADPDDLGLGQSATSLSTGNSGSRVACCTIYLVA